VLVRPAVTPSGPLSPGSSATPTAAGGNAFDGGPAAGRAGIGTLESLLAAHQSLMASLAGTPEHTQCSGCGQKALGLRRCSRCKQASYCRCAYSSLACNMWHQMVACCACAAVRRGGCLPCNVSSAWALCRNGPMVSCCLKQKSICWPIPRAVRSAKRSIGRSTRRSADRPEAALASSKRHAERPRWRLTAGLPHVLPPPQHALSSVLWDVLQLMNHT